MKNIINKKSVVNFNFKCIEYSLKSKQFCIYTLSYTVTSLCKLIFLTLHKSALNSWVNGFACTVFNTIWI